MKELALVVAILGGLAMFGGLVELNVNKDKCWDGLGVEVCVGYDEGKF